MSGKRYLGITGGCLRPNGFELGEGKYYQKARLLRLDLDTGLFDIQIEKSDGGDNYPDENPNLQFTAACVEDGSIWVPTDTEVHQYNLADMSLVSVFSHPCFQNIHSVHLLSDGNLYVTSTGLDNVVVLDKTTGDIIKIMNTEDKDPWHRFDPTIDYRLMHSTRPHDSHPNYVFEFQGDQWVTRCTQEDAVKLGDVSNRMDISGDDSISVHDGVVWNSKVVFTRVDGQIVICDQKTKRREQTIDVFANSRNRPVGWCRGLYIDGDIFYLGYSKLRQTKLKQKLKFLTQGNFKYREGNDALVVAFNIKTGDVMQTYQTPEGMLDAIYGIFPL